MVQLGEVATIERRGVDPGSLAPDTLYLGLEHIERGGRVIGHDTVAGAQLASTKFTFTADHVLFGKLRPNLGKVCRPQFAGVCSTDILPLKPSQHLDRNYLAHFLSQPTIVDFAASQATGANLPRLSPTQLAKFELPLPSLDEQRRIAAILDRADALRVKRNFVIAKLDELAQAIFIDMFGRDQPTRPVSELCELCVDCVNRTAPVVDLPTDFKMLRTTNVRNGRVDTTNVRYVDADVFDRWNRRATPRRGDVILTREAPVGEVGVLDSDDKVFLGQRLFLYRPDPTLLTSEFLLAAFRSPLLQAQFDRLGSGSTVKHLPLPACHSFMIPAPPIELQREYSGRVQTLSTIGTATNSAATREDELFASLQSRAFRSEL